MIGYLVMGTLSSELGPIVERHADAPRVYADANVPLGLVRFMRQVLCWDVFFVLEHSDLRRAADAEHFRVAREMRRTLVTLDRDFTDPRRFPPARAAGSSSSRPRTSAGSKRCSDVWTRRCCGRALRQPSAAASLWPAGSSTRIPAGPNSQPRQPLQPCQPLQPLQSPSRPSPPVPHFPSPPALLEPQ